MIFTIESDSEIKSQQLLEFVEKFGLRLGLMSIEYQPMTI
jgi:hypothetical protein